MVDLFIWAIMILFVLYLGTTLLLERVWWKS